MPKGARFVWNTRYFHVARKGEAADGKHILTGEHVAGLVEYCGTRETVALNFSADKAGLPATDKQNEFIKELLGNIPEGKDSLEYNDYLQAPTRQNASELIAFLSEQVNLYDDFDEASNLVEYAAKRPGAVIVGNHGLFSSYENVDLEKAKKNIANHEGNIWTHVLSLRREDADRLGYDSQKSWKNLVKSNIDMLAKYHHIDMRNFRWYAAMHNTGHHPHIHLFVYSENPTEGFFSEKKEKAITKCKSKFANQIFADEMHNEYVEKTQYRNSIKQNTEQILSELLQKPLEQYNLNVQKDLINQMFVLSDKLPDKKCKYGYLPKEIKCYVDELLKSIVNNSPALSELYGRWCDTQYNIERIYVNNPARQAPIEENDNFRNLKNIIVNEAYKLNHSLKNDEIINVYAVEKIPEGKENHGMTVIDSYNNAYARAEYKTENVDFNSLLNRAIDVENRTGEDCRKVAECYKFGNGTEKDIANAVMWYGIAADQYNDGYASYKLGQLYLYGADGLDVNTELGNYYSRLAYITFKSEIENSSFFNGLEEGAENLFYNKNVAKEDAYKEYLMARMFLKGEGVEQNYNSYIKGIILSEENGYTHFTAYEKYQLGKIYFEGIQTKQNIDKGLHWLEKSTFDGDYNAPYLLHEIHSKGVYVEKNMEIAELYLNIAAELNNPYAQYALGKIELQRNNVDKGLEWLKKSAQLGNSDAYYQLGSIYSLEKYGINKQNIADNCFSKALELYTKSFKNCPDGNTAYNIGVMYHYGFGVERNIDEAIKWYKRSLELGNNRASEKIQEAQDNARVAALSVATTACHFGRIIQNQTIKGLDKKFSSDSKVLRREKINKIYAGHAADDKEQSFDY